MTLLEQLVSVSMQDTRITEAELMERLRIFNSTGVPGAVLSEEDLEIVARRLSERLAIDVDLGSVITSRDYEPWLDARKRDLEWGRWMAYKQMLLQQGRAPRVIDKTDELTDKILDLAGDPAKPGSWARRGLVLGDVQSGKTGTYLGLLNKAADAGYRLFILLAGNTEVLRKQTQARLDEAFIGRDSSNPPPKKGTSVTPSKHIGVGLIRKDLAQSSGMTTALWDFRRSSYEATNITIQTDAAHPYVFVVKKNRSILRANAKGEDSGLYLWLKEQAAASGGRLNIPVMVLDDESDYASVNTRSEDDPTAINEAIRDILGLFTRSSYVAFTATPFANIFIDHNVENDLFPRHFVYALDAPTNYVGSEKTFGTTEEKRTDGIFPTDDAEDVIPLSHKSSLRVKAIPESLVTAIDAFLISNAIRDLRGQTEAPRSMLVNVSRYKAVQRQVYDLLADHLSETRNAIEFHHADGFSQHSVIRRLKNAFDLTYPTAGYRWDNVLRQLPKSNSDVRVMLFNSDSDKKLAEQESVWDRPPRMIAVGGDVLSRGLTLEGLCVSYFARRVTASDTLLQMARWFGYRDGYDDLCRLWINRDSADHYRFSHDSVEELRADLKVMLRQKLTPEDFGLAVQKHPGSLLITARNKAKNAVEVKKTISLAGRRLEATKLLPDQEKNRLDLQALLASLEREGLRRDPLKGWPYWQGADRSVIAEYLEQFSHSVPRTDLFFSGEVLSRWARSAKSERMRYWDVVLASGRGGQTAAISLDGGSLLEFPLPQRRIIESDGEWRVSGKRQRLAGPTDIVRLLDPEKAAAAEEEFRRAEQEKNFPETIYYAHLDRPTLIVYPLGNNPESRTEEHEEGVKEVALDAETYAVALKVAIPGNSANPRDESGDVTYMINTVAQQNWLTEIAGEDDTDADY